MGCGVGEETLTWMIQYLDSMLLHMSEARPDV